MTVRSCNILPLGHDGELRARPESVEELEAGEALDLVGDDRGGAAGIVGGCSYWWT
jgi:hypothetical protein